MKSESRNYIYSQSTTSLCPKCLKPIEAKIVIEKDKVYLIKNCPKHGKITELLEEDASFYKKQSLYQKPGTISKTQTKFSKGCPFDCGLCTEHEQHTCIALIEVTNKCNLACPTCYANSGKGSFLSLKKIEKMLDFYQDTEFGNAELVQLSGGEPTLHPDITKIIDLSIKKKIKYTMLNTNGIKIAEDEDFVKKLSQFKKGFEVYLQFDGFKPSTYQHLRGKNILSIKKKAIKNLQKYKIPITLVSTIEEGINDDEIGQIVEFGINTNMIRGINFQPLAFFGRLPKSQTKNRVTLTGILKRIESQTSQMLKIDDFIPLPCHPEKVAFTYLYKTKNGFTPITRGIDTTKYLPMIKNTFTFMPEDFTSSVTKNLLNPKNYCTCCNPFAFISTFKKLIPANYYRKTQQEKTDYINNNTFRISISSFIDAYNFEVKAMKKECVHVITPDLHKIPFSAYNILHRKKYESI